jgi:hypothetical protein
VHGLTFVFGLAGRILHAAVTEAFHVNSELVGLRSVQSDFLLVLSGGADVASA